MTGMAACCPRAASGHFAAAPRSVMNSRRLMSDIGLPLALAPPVGFPHAQPALERPASPWGGPEQSIFWPKTAYFPAAG
jgi:hypothetical protein